MTRVGSGRVACPAFLTADRCELTRRCRGRVGSRFQVPGSRFQAPGSELSAVPCHKPEPPAALTVSPFLGTSPDSRNQKPLPQPSTSSGKYCSLQLAACSL